MKIIKYEDLAKRPRPSYRRGVEFLALNLHDLSDLVGEPAVLVLAEAFGKEPDRVADNVRRCYELHMAKERLR